MVSRVGINGVLPRLAALLAVLACACSGAAARASGSSVHVTAWLPYWEMPAALDSTLANAGSIGTASPYWYEVVGDSTVHEQTGAASATVIAALQARHVQIVPMVTEAAGMTEFARILASPARRARLVRALVRIALHGGYAGLDLDFESFAYDRRHRQALADRVAAQYPRLISQVCSALHAIARSCQVAVMARTSSAHVYAHRDIPTWVYDYSALARAADRLQVMAYDAHSPGGPAGPIAPLPWVRQVIAFARTQARPARFELGVPAYGYDWYRRTSATAVFARQAAALLAAAHVHPHWDAVQAEETATWRQGGRRHVLWYADAAADAVRARLAAAAGFSGVAVWAAGYEQPQLWRQLAASGN